MFVCAIVITLFVCSRTHTSRIIKFPRIWTGNNVIKIQISGKVNPSIAIPFRVGNYQSVFILDTGYAGAPVLNTKILDVKFDGDDIDSYLERISHVTCSNEAANRKLDNFKTSNSCIDYTSGCVLRLMGIGETSEKASDMLLCPHIAMKSASSSEYLNVKKNVGITEADVLMTNHELNSPHILTLDYLRHLAPCVLHLRQNRMSLAMGNAEFVYERAQSHHISSETIGGAYVCALEINGVTIRCTVDTGASTTVCIGSSVLRRIKNYNQTEEHIEQIGINSEVICSEIVLANVKFCTGSFLDVPVFVNQQEVEETDGYVGLGFLQAFDLLITPVSLFAKYNGAAIASLKSYEHVRRRGLC